MRRATTRRRRGVAIGVSIAVIAMAGCGGDDSASDTPGAANAPAEADAGDPAESAPDADDGGGTTADTGVIVTVGGVEYVVDTLLGGSCEVAGSGPDDLDVRAYGYDVESGQRVELTLSRQSADSSISGEDEYFGSLGIASGAESWQMRTTEAPPLSNSGSGVSGAVTMEDGDGVPAEVEFEVDCP